MIGRICGPHPLLVVIPLSLIAGDSDLDNFLKRLRRLDFCSQVIDVITIVIVLDVERDYVDSALPTGHLYC